MNLDALSTKEYRKLIEKLSGYCWRFEKRHKRLPTFRQVAKRFSLNYDDIETLIYDSEHIDIIEGGRVGGLGGGVYVIETRGKFMLECYENPEMRPA
jgi:hypothetical protein